MTTSPGPGTTGSAGNLRKTQEPGDCCSGIGRAAVLGFSAGSGSVLEFGLRHPDRVIGLILANCRLGVGVTMSKVFAPVLRLADGADRLFWVFKKLMPTAFSQMMGVPKGYRPTSEQVQVMAGSRELLFPLRPRREGRRLRRLRLQSGCRPVPLGAAEGPDAGDQRPGRSAGAVPVRRP